MAEKLMTANDLYSIGARLLAIYFVVVGLSSLPGAFVVYDAALDSDSPRAELHLVAAISQSVLFVLFGVALILLRKIRKGTIDGFAVGSGVSAGIQLLGLFFAVTGSVGLVREIGMAFVASSSWSLQLALIIPSLLQFLIGLFFTLCSEAIARKVGNAT